MKNKEEILNQSYITAKDLKILIPELGINRCVEYIKMIRNEMKEKGYVVPKSKEYLALTKLVRKKFGI